MLWLTMLVQRALGDYLLRKHEKYQQNIALHHIKQVDIFPIDVILSVF